MANQEENVHNERLRRARILHKWSQADLAERAGTSFEMVSRWERGVTVPSAYYQELLCTALGKTSEELGFVRPSKAPFPLPSTPFVFYASSHTDAERPIVALLKAALQDRGLPLSSARQVGRLDAAILPDIIRKAKAVVILLSPEAQGSRHVRTALELARTFLVPVYGIWVEGESWQACLPSGSSEFVTLVDAREDDKPNVIEEIAAALAQKETAVHAIAEPPAPVLERQAIEPALLATTPPLRPRPGFSLVRAGPLIGTVVLIIAGSVLGSFSWYHAAVNARNRASATQVVRGGTWVAVAGDPSTLLPDAQLDWAALNIESALYLPLFYGDAQGNIQAGAATVVPTVKNGGVNADATVWTFHVRPHLLWSDGMPYDARDVDYTWRLWSDPTFGAGSLSTFLGLKLITRVDVSPDNLSITFHLKRSFSPFLVDLWVDALSAPLPAHHFRSMTPASILKSSDNLNPQVTSGPFMMSESVPADHYTVVRNPRYYRAREGLPYLDKIVFIYFNDTPTSLEDLRKGYQTSSSYIFDISSFQPSQKQTDYRFFYPPSDTFEALYFNFHNQILATHLEVRQAMAMALDQHSLIEQVMQGHATPLCTDHPPALHPGYESFPPCPSFNPAAANKLLDDNGWVRGRDGVRAKTGKRLEFEYSTAYESGDVPLRPAIQAIVQSQFQQIGIKLDIQDYPSVTFFGPFLNNAKPSPPSGAVAGHYDISEFLDTWLYDPDDASLLACDQFPPVGVNFAFYCNPTLDALFRQEQATVDVGVRQQIFQQIHQIELTDFPFITLFSHSWWVLAKKRAHNFNPGPFNTNINMEEWWCDQGKC